MSDFTQALNYVLDWEDPHRKYETVPDAGGQAISGVNSSKWPKQFEYLNSLSIEQRPDAIITFYQLNFWNALKLVGINSQALVNRVMDEGVNAGGTTACMMLQQVANTLRTKLSAELTVDGILGPLSITAINSLFQPNLLAMYRQARFNRYLKIVEKNPSDAKYLVGWKTRALA